MAQIGNIPEIIEVKQHLEQLKLEGFVKEWELPYENLLTRRSAAIFFLTPVDESKNDHIRSELGRYPGFLQRENTEQKLSKLKYRVSFDKDFELGKGYLGEEAKKVKTPPIATQKKRIKNTKFQSSRPKSLNELVVRLMQDHEVETRRPEKNAKAFKECIDRDYVHILFKKTGTELGVQLFQPECNFTNADFNKATGKVKISGGLILNYDKVRCVAEIDISTCEGIGHLEPVTDDVYEVIIGRKK